VGKEKREWQDTETVLSFFDRKISKARIGYERFVAEGLPMGRRPDLVGGGLVRSAGGWSQVLSLRRHGVGLASDERILGGGGFIAEVLSQAEEKLQETLRLKAGKIVFPGFLFRRGGVGSGSFRKPDRKGGKDPKNFLPNGGQEIRVFGGRSGALLGGQYFLSYPTGQLPGVA